jgi:hypothetical protein
MVKVCEPTFTVSPVLGPPVKVKVLEEESNEPPLWFVAPCAPKAVPVAYPELVLPPENELITLKIIYGTEITTANTVPRKFR